MGEILDSLIVLSNEVRELKQETFPLGLQILLAVIALVSFAMTVYNTHGVKFIKKNMKNGNSIEILMRKLEISKRQIEQKSNGKIASTCLRDLKSSLVNIKRYVKNYDKETNLKELIDEIESIDAINQANREEICTKIELIINEIPR